MSIPIAELLRAAEAAVLSTTEDLTIPIDYDDGGGGAVGDPPTGTVFIKQSDIDDMLTDNSWTAFKHIQAVWEALPAIFAHEIILDCAAGIHRPLASQVGEFDGFFFARKFIRA